MAKIDWDKVEEENKSQYKNYAPDGEYTTKVESVELVTASTGNTGIRFNLAETEDYKFPRYGHTFYNTQKDSWRQHHMKECFVTLGFTEDQAKKAVEQCEDAKDIMEAYQKMFEKALPKQKPFEVVVFKERADDQYSTWDFKRDEARTTYPKKDDKKPATTGEVVSPDSIKDDILENSEEVDLTDIPF